MNEQTPKDREQVLYGVKACQAVYEQRPDDILRIYYRAERRRELGSMLKWAAARRIPYRELDEAAMRRVAGTIHHEGLAMAVNPLRYGVFGASDSGASVSGANESGANGSGAVRSTPDRSWVALDGVENPYNLGAIVRSCAFFAVPVILVGGAIPDEKVNGAAIRAAEGGAEWVDLIGCQNLADALAAVRVLGLTPIGLEADAPRVFGAHPLPRPVVLVAGHEQAGLSPEVRNECDGIFAIPGEGGVGSLNVSVSVGIALAELFRDDQKTGASRKQARKSANRRR